MMKKKKHSRSQSSSKKTIEPSPDSSPSPSPRLLSIFRSKLVSGKDLKHMFRGMKTKTAPGLSSQSRIVRCPKCHKLLQEPIDATIYKCSGCNSILQAKRWDLESNGDSIPEALLYSQNRSLSTQLESAEAGSKTPMRSTHREYNWRASPSVERGYDSETVYKHETSDVHREWMRRADEFSVTGESDAFASARSSPYNSRSNASEWTHHERRYQVPFYPASPSPSSAYEYGYNSPFHGSQASASEQSYYHHHQPNQFKQKEREGWFQESSAASPIRFPGETSNKNYYPSSSQYHNLYEPRSSVYSERSYQAAKAPLRSTYSEHSKSGTSREKRSQRDKKKDVRKKKPVVKRYVLPSAGGAPFATCSYCLELLQLPQVSLHGKHKGYQVRCGSCSGVLKFSVREKADTVLDSPGFAEETVTNHQDSASEGHEEIYPDESHMSCSDNDDVILRRNVETFEDNESKEDTRSISSTLLDSKLEALQPSLNQKLREQQSASSESIGETSRKHLERSEEACSEKSTEMDNNISERVSCDVEEVGLYEKNETLEPEVMFGDGSGESVEVPVYKKERMSDSSIEAERVADKPVSHSGETRVLSENTGYSQEFDWEETREKEEYGGEGKWEDSMGDKLGLILEKSRYTGDSTSDNSSRNGEAYEDTKIISAAPQNENQRFIGQSGEDTVTTSRTHEEQSKYENLSERDTTISDSVRYIVSEESRYDTGKVSEDGSAASLTKASETFSTSIEGERGEERSASHQMNLLPNENVEDSYERLEYVGERTWEEETMEDRAGLHLEEYESNYENYSKPFEWISEGASAFHNHMHEPKLGTINEPDEDADGRLKSSSRGSFSDHESSEESAVFQESQDAQSKYEYEIPSERQELSNTERHEIQEEDRYEINETFGSVASLEKTGETNIGERGEERSVSHHHMATENENLEISYGTVEQVYLEGGGLQLEECHNNPHEWTSERAPTFRLHEYELGTMSASEEDANGRSSSSTDSTNDHEAVAHEEPSLMDENKFEELKVTLMVEDGPSLHLDKYGNDSTKLEDTFERTSERAPTFRLHEYELGTMLEPEEHPDGRSESSSTGSFNNHESSKEMDHEEDPRLVIDSRSKAQQEGEMAKDTVPLHLECENESMKLNETFKWTSERVLTFSHREHELGTMPEPDEDASESSLRGAFNDHGVSEERSVSHKDEPWLVEDYETKALKASVIADSGPSLHLEKCENVVLNQTVGPRDNLFRLSHDDTLEQERITFHLEKSQEKQVNLRQAFKQQGDTEDNIPASEGHESPCKMAEVDSEAEEDMLGDHLEHLQIENERSGLTSEPYSHFYNTTDPSEIVGLRLALYETQTSPLSSPMHTPTGSPLHILMRSPIASPMHTHIVSPMRSPINSSGSLSDVLFFGKKA
ncbi:BnaC06g15920D [Brassica napus]|uniref:BnaC06g15920D protein n=1 Tax=Brassica napus TaxID=3708 RepID=A0A078H3Q6_BRANA|nr:BnaC06g15920D [Brassica napus]